MDVVIRQLADTYPLPSASVDRTYPLDKIAEAFTYMATGQKAGNVIITMDV